MKKKEKGTQILINLARYKFLDRLQMKRLGISNKNAHFTQEINPLIEAKLIWFETGARHGSGDLYCLTEKGKDKLLRDKSAPFDAINFMKNKPSIEDGSWWHILNSVWCQIEFDLSVQKKDNLDFKEWFELYRSKAEFYNRDMDKLGSVKGGGLTKSTKIDLEGGKWFDPDGMFSCNGRLFLFEYEHGTYTKRSMEKILIHCQSLKLAALGRQLNLKSTKGEWKMHRVLFVYHTHSILKSSIKECNKTLSQALLTTGDWKQDEIEGLLKGKWFLFKSIEEVKPEINWLSDPIPKDYFDNWLTLAGDRVMMFS